MRVERKLQVVMASTFHSFIEVGRSGKTELATNKKNTLEVETQIPENPQWCKSPVVSDEEGG